ERVVARQIAGAFEIGKSQSEKGRQPRAKPPRSVLRLLDRLEEVRNILRLPRLEESLLFEIDVRDSGRAQPLSHRVAFVLRARQDEDVAGPEREDAPGFGERQGRLRRVEKRPDLPRDVFREDGPKPAGA